MLFRSHLLEWTREPHEDYTNAGDMYRALVGQYGRYMGHVLKNIGGILTTPRTNDQPGPVFEYASKEKQQRAMAFLNTQLFTTPGWLIDAKLYSLAPVDFGLVAQVQTKTIDDLLDAGRLIRLTQQEADLGPKAYTLTGMLHDLQSGLFAELLTGKAIDEHRRRLQRYYVNKLVVTLGADTAGRREVQSVSDAYANLKTSAKSLAATIKQSLLRYPSGAMREHLADLYDRLELTLKPRN